SRLCCSLSQPVRSWPRRARYEFCDTACFGGNIAPAHSARSDGFTTDTTKSIGPIIRQRVAVWDWRVDEAAGGFLCSIRSNLRVAEGCTATSSFLDDAWASIDVPNLPNF